MVRIDTSRFDLIEYSVFSISLAISALIGIYFGCIKGGQNTVSGYLLGGKQMSVFPVAMSLITTYISGVTLLGVPTEVYTFGTQYLLCVAAHLIVSFFIGFIILPVFYKLQLISLYEYMELRFSRRVRKIISFLFVLQLLCYIPIVIYGPALALNQVSGMNIHVITPIISLVCIFYTTLGGLKAVVWADTLQGTVMIGSVLTVLYLGIQEQGGINEVYRKSVEGERIEFFNMDINPTTRLSFWSSTIGFTFYWLANFAYHPASVQRFISLPTFKQARTALLLLCFGVTGFTTLCGIIGLIIYAKYTGCDPFTTKAITRPDQIVPLFVLEVTGHIRGLSGLFMAGVVCAALSSMSTALNTVAGTLYEDFVEPIFKTKPSDYCASLIMKCLVIVFGTTCVLLVYVCEQLGPIIEITTGFVGMSAGTTLGIFIMGMFFPWANTRGTMSGGLISIIFMTWLMIGNTVNTTKGLIRHQTKPISTELCANMTTIILTSITEEMTEEVFPLYRISVFYYCVLGCSIVLLIGLPISWLTMNQKEIEQVEMDLISPIVKYFYKDKTEKLRYNGLPIK